MANRRNNRKVAVLNIMLVMVALILVMMIVAQALGRVGKNDANASDSANPSGKQTVESKDGSGGESESESTSPEAANAARDALLEECRTLEAGYFYDEAITRLMNAGELQNADTDAMLNQIQSKKNTLVKYEGPFYHVFYHSLIVDTAKAFDGDFASKGYNMYMTTVDEFKKMLPLFQEEGYILIDITSIAELVDGKIVQKEIYLPEGKKPMIISVDDVNYYEYMKTDGFATRLDVDENGRVVTMVKNDAGEEVATYDGDVFPILDTYVAEHPEFSYRGAKGIAATTGYQGAFGYRITDLEDYDEETQQWMLDQVTKVSKALRASGWQIASHSYTHNQYWNDKSMTMEQLKYDTGRWVNEIMPYVGETHIILAPFGVYYDPTDERFQYLVDNGFYIYCTVYSGMTTDFNEDSMIQSRLNLDGLTMIKYPERISKYFFDPQQVLDPSRPAMD